MLAPKYFIQHMNRGVAVARSASPSSLCRCGESCNFMAQQPDIITCQTALITWLHLLGVLLLLLLRHGTTIWSFRLGPARFGSLWKTPKENDRGPPIWCCVKRLLNRVEAPENPIPPSPPPTPLVAKQQCSDAGGCC